MYTDMAESVATAALSILGWGSGVERISGEALTLGHCELYASASMIFVVAQYCGERVGAKFWSVRGQIWRA